MKYIYLISAIILFILSILVKRKEEKANFITTFFVNIIIFTCYNIITCMLLKVLKIPITLLSLSIVNVITSIIIIFIIIKHKKIQKYYISIKDIIAIILIIIIGLIIAYINFGYPFKISYVTIDAANHYKMSTDFYKTGEIEIGSIPGAYINLGIIFKIFLELFGSFNGYKLFIICEIIKLILSGILFYLAINKFVKNKFQSIIAIIFGVIYMVGYPLNGMLSGFVYLQMAINIVNAIIIVVINENEMSNRIKNLLLFLLCFGLIFTYYILVPPVYIAIFIYEYIKYRKEKLKFVKNVLEIFLIPCIVAILFFLMPSILNQSNLNPAVHMGSAQATQGYTFVSYYATFIIFIPFNIYYIINKIGNRKKDFLTILISANVIYIIFALILKHFGILARYYCMKPYFMLWLVSLLITVKTIVEILNSNSEKTYKILVNIVATFYIIGLIVSCLIGPSSIKVFDNEKETIKSMYNIFKINRGIMLHETFELIYSPEELEILRQATKQLNNKKVVYFEDGLNKQWLRSLLVDSEDSNIDLYDNTKEEIEDYIFNEEEKYVICYKSAYVNKYFTEIIDKLEKELETIVSCGKLTIFYNKGE